MERLRAAVYGTFLLLVIGWVLTIGKSIFVPAVLGAVIVYVIVGLAHVLGRLPLLGPRLPLQLRYLFSMGVIALAFFALAYLIAANKERALLLAPQYQRSLLASIQGVAVFFGFETEPTWTTLRQELLGQINLQRLLGSLLASAGSILVTFIVVFLYATFLLVERAHFETKLAQLSDDPQRVARIREVIQTINRRIGSYLALKTLLSLLLGAVSWGVMALYGLEFALLWAVLTAFLNFVPYVGSVLGVALPALMAVVQFGEPGPILTLVLALSAVQFVIGNFLDPYVMGSSLNLSPFAILISLAVWSELWGIPGAFLAVPITAIVTIVFSEFPGTRPVAVLLSKNGAL
ncbi:MAG TPA: AI-2E family transporter [Rubrivivax sp.]|nr:AI-2E family transporter [Rubrivivax sp.]